MPLYGHELTTATTPFDAGLGRVGEVRQDAGRLRRPRGAGGGRRAGRGRRRRASWSAWSPRAAGCRAPATRWSTGRRRGDRRGHLRRALPDPGQADRHGATSTPAHAAPGTEGVAVDIRGTHEPYEVVALPFYKRELTRPVAARRRRRSRRLPHVPPPGPSPARCTPSHPGEFRHEQPPAAALQQGARVALGRRGRRRRRSASPRTPPTRSATSSSSSSPRSATTSPRARPAASWSPPSRSATCTRRSPVRSPRSTRTSWTTRRW